MSRRHAGTASALALALVWIAAAVLKSLDPAAFAEQIARHRIVPEPWGSPLAYLFIAVESLLGFALVAGFRRRAACGASALLLLFFMVVTGWAWAHGNALDCGCFGRLAERGPGATILEDAGLLALALIGWRAGGAAIRPSRRATAAFAALAPLAVILPLLGPVLPVDSLVTDLRPGADLSNLAVDNLTTPIGRGTVVLALLSDRCEACVAALPALNAIAQAGDGATVIGVFAGDRAGAMEWTLTHVPEFEVGDMPASVLRRYYRRLPSVALLRDGIVRKVWRRAPTLAEARSAGA